MLFLFLLYLNRIVFDFFYGDRNLIQKVLNVSQIDTLADHFFGDLRLEYFWISFMTYDIRVTKQDRGRLVVYDLRDLLRLDDFRGLKDIILILFLVLTTINNHSFSFFFNRFGIGWFFTNNDWLFLLNLYCFLFFLFLNF